MATLVREPRKVDRQMRETQRALAARLTAVRRQLRTHLLVEGLFWTLLAIVVAAAASMAVDWLLRLSLPARLALLAIAAAVILVVAVRRLVRPMLMPLGHLDLAELLDRRIRGIAQQIANVLQLPQLIEADDHASPTMVRAAVTQSAQALSRIDLASTLNTSRRNGLLAGCAALVLAMAGFAVLAPDVTWLWARRWFAMSELRWPQQTYLSVVGLGDRRALLVPRGELSLLQIDARAKFTPGDTDQTWRLGGRGEALIVESPSAPVSRPPEQVALAYVLADGSKRRGNAVQFDATNFRYELPPLAEPIELTITGGDDWLGPITVEPIDRPVVSRLDITAQRPGASESETQTVGDASAQFLYLPQTKLKLKLVADQPLAGAEAIDKGMPLAGWQRRDDRTYTVEWEMHEPLALEFRLESQRGGLTSKPYYLAIGLLRDREPRLTMHAAGVGRRVTPVVRMPLTIRASDDFGVASLALDLERTEVAAEKPQVHTEQVDLTKELSAEPEAASGAAVESTARTDIGLEHELTLRDRGFAPGHVLKLRATATDRCALGTQTGHSRTLVFQVVSSDELFYELLMRQREQRAKFNTATESAKTQRTVLAELKQPADAVGAVRALQVISRQVGQVANHLDASLVEMTLNDLGNPQAREMMQSSIITPMRALHADLLPRLRAAIESLAQQAVPAPERLKEAQDLSDQAVQAMEAILAQMAQWESFVDVVNQLKQIIQRQTEVLQTTEEIKKKRTDALFDE